MKEEGEEEATGRKVMGQGEGEAKEKLSAGLKKSSALYFILEDWDPETEPRTTNYKPAHFLSFPGL